MVVVGRWCDVLLPTTPTCCHHPWADGRVNGVDRTGQETGQTDRTGSDSGGGTGTGTGTALLLLSPFTAHF